MFSLFQKVFTFLEIRKTHNIVTRYEKNMIFMVFNYSNPHSIYKIYDFFIYLFILFSFFLYQILAAAFYIFQHFRLNDQSMNCKHMQTIHPFEFTSLQCIEYDGYIACHCLQNKISSLTLRFCTFTFYNWFSDEVGDTYFT